MTDGPLLTEAEAAALLRRSRRFVRQLRQAGEVRWVPGAGRAPLLICKASLDAYIERTLQCHASNPPRLVEQGGVWYVAYNDGGRSQRTSLRTEDLQVAQARFQGWLKAREEAVVASEPTTVAGAFALYIDQHGPSTASPETLEHVAAAHRLVSASAV